MDNKDRPSITAPSEGTPDNWALSARAADALDRAPDLQRPSESMVAQEPIKPRAHGSSEDTTTYTFLDYSGLGLILMPIEAVGHRWLLDEPISSHTLFAAGTAMVAGFVVLGLSKLAKKVRNKGPLWRSLATATRQAWVWFAVAVVIIFGVPMSVSYVSRSSQSIVHVPAAGSMLCTDGPCSPPNLKPAPQYLKEIAVVIGPEPAHALLLNATAEITTGRLRVFVDYAEYRSGWMKKTRAFVGELREPVKGQVQRLPLINVATQPNAGVNDLWWGDPSARHYVWTPGPSSLLPAGIVHARIAVVGPNGEEQHHYFTLLTKLPEPPNYRVGVLPDSESGAWIEQWEKE